MSTINVGINGFGRIGKCCFMQLFEDDNICIKAINIKYVSSAILIIDNGISQPIIFLLILVDK